MTIRALIILFLLLLFASGALGQYGVDGEYSVPCTVKNGHCIGIIMHNDGSFWISEYHSDGTWTDIKPANCPNWRDTHPRRLSVSDPLYGDYRCSYETAEPGVFSRSAVQPVVKESKGASFWHYLETHKEVLAGDAICVVGQGIWGWKATEYRHTKPGEAAWQTGVIAGFCVASNHLWRWLVNKDGMNDGDQHVQWMWVTPVAIASGSRTYDYENGSNTRFPPGQLRLPHYRD